jgi:thymidylate synthase (FAD)
MKVDLVNYMPNPVQTMALAVSKCYDTEPKESVVKGCIKRKHDSVCEHSMYVFEISGVSRAFLAQITRHRHLQFTVQSQRYSHATDYVIPEHLPLEQQAFLEASMIRAFNDYEYLLKMGVPKEDARFALPEGTAVKMVVSGNYRAWMKFCELRLDKHAQGEIRSFAKEVDRLIHEVTPLPMFETEE